MYQKLCNKEDFFCKKSDFSFLENLRNQGENLEKFKKQPCKAKKPEYWKNGKFKKQAQYWKNPTVSYVPILSVVTCLEWLELGC